jgi:hypothetical protein
MPKTHVTFCSTEPFRHTKTIYWWHGVARHDSKWVTKLCPLCNSHAGRNGEHVKKSSLFRKFDQKMKWLIQGKNEHWGKHKCHWARPVSYCLPACLPNGRGMNFRPKPCTNISLLYTQKTDTCTDSTASIFKFQSRAEYQMHVQSTSISWHEHKAYLKIYSRQYSLRKKTLL